MLGPSHPSYLSGCSPADFPPSKLRQQAGNGLPLLRWASSLVLMGRTGRRGRTTPKIAAPAQPPPKDPLGVLHGGSDTASGEVLQHMFEWAERNGHESRDSWPGLERSHASALVSIAAMLPAYACTSTEVTWSAMPYHALDGLKQLAADGPLSLGSTEERTLCGLLLVEPTYVLTSREYESPAEAYARCIHTILGCKRACEALASALQSVPLDGRVGDYPSPCCHLVEAMAMCAGEDDSLRTHVVDIIVSTLDRCTASDLSLEGHMGELLNAAFTTLGCPYDAFLTRSSAFSQTPLAKGIYERDKRRMLKSFERGRLGEAEDSHSEDSERSTGSLLSSKGAESSSSDDEEEKEDEEDEEEDDEERSQQDAGKPAASPPQALAEQVLGALRRAVLADKWQADSCGDKGFVDACEHLDLPVDVMSRPARDLDANVSCSFFFSKGTSEEVQQETLKAQKRRHFNRLRAIRLDQWAAAVDADEEAAADKSFDALMDKVRLCSPTSVPTARVSCLLVALPTRRWP